MRNFQENVATRALRARGKRDTSTSTDIVSKAVAAALQIGVELPYDIPYGEHRYPGAGKKASNQACAVTRTSDAILMFDHSTQLSAYAFEDNRSDLTRAEVESLKRKVEVSRLQRIAEVERGYDLAADDLNRRIVNLSEAKPDFPYFIEKQIEAFAPLFLQLDEWRVIIPLEYGGKIVNRQAISKDGTKRPYPGARLSGTYAVIARPQQHRRILIATGIATTCTVSMLEPASMAVAAISDGNLLSVAKTFRELYPHDQIVICGDDDRETEKRTGRNSGRLKANEAARAIGGLVVFPEFPPGIPGSDFNDVYCAGCF